MFDHVLTFHTVALHACFVPLLSGALHQLQSLKTDDMITVSLTVFRCCIVTVTECLLTANAGCSQCFLTGALPAHDAHSVCSLQPRLQLVAAVCFAATVPNTWAGVCKPEPLSCMVPCWPVPTGSMHACMAQKTWWFEHLYMCVWQHLLLLVITVRWGA